MRVARKLITALGLATIGMVALAVVLPERDHISPESFEVAYILACAQEVRLSDIAGARERSGKCPGLPAKFEFMASGGFTVVGTEFGQSAKFEVNGEDCDSSLRCFDVSSNRFPEKCERQ